MDLNNREVAATAARVKKNLVEKAEDARDALNEFGRKAADTLDDSRGPAANAIGWTATSLHAGAERLSGFTHLAAERLEDAADYVRETDLGRAAEDLRRTVKKYPGRSLAAAAALGFLIVLGVRRLSR